MKKINLWAAMVAAGYLLVMAAAGIAPALAADATLVKGGVSTVCAYDSIAFDASGNVILTCHGEVAPPPPPPPVDTCAAFSGRVRDLGTAGTGFGNDVQGPPGSVSVFAMPTAAQGNTAAGSLNLYPRPFTVKDGPAFTEIKISKCKGDFVDEGDGCYTGNGAIDGGQINQYWARQYTARYPNAASFISHHRCLIDSGAWFINVRLKTYPTDTACGNACGWVAVWHLSS
jgi:hypothetical protein